MRQHLQILDVLESLEEQSRLIKLTQEMEVAGWVGWISQKLQTLSSHNLNSTKTPNVFWPSPTFPSTLKSLCISEKSYPSVSDSFTLTHQNVCFVGDI